MSGVMLLMNAFPSRQQEDLNDALERQALKLLESLLAMIRYQARDA